MWMLELTEAGVPGASVSFLYGADMFIHILAFPFGLSFTVIGFTVYDSHGISLGSKGPKQRPFFIQLWRESATRVPNSLAVSEFGLEVGSLPSPLHPISAPVPRR